MSSTMSFKPLDHEARQELLQVARHAIELYLDRHEWPTLETDRPELREPRAAFVTLRNRETGELRGCRGDVRPTRPLIECVARQAVSAATNDYRFPTVTSDELPELTLHISALGPLLPIEPPAIERGRHGLMIKHGNKSGLLLPQVPALYSVETVDDFLRMLCRKAGLPPHAWREPGTELLAFEADNWGEDDQNEKTQAKRPAR